VVGYFMLLRSTAGRIASGSVCEDLLACAGCCEAIEVVTAAAVGVFGEAVVAAGGWE